MILRLKINNRALLSNFLKFFKKVIIFVIILIIVFFFFVKWESWLKKIKNSVQDCNLIKNCNKFKFNNKKRTIQTSLQKNKIY